MTDETRQILLASALSGMMVGALAEAIGEMAKELRRYAGGDFDKRLEYLERQAVRSVENAPIDRFSESEQLTLIEQTRAVIVAKFKDIRDAT